MNCIQRLYVLSIVSFIFTLIVGVSPVYAVETVWTPKQSNAKDWLRDPEVFIYSSSSTVLAGTGKYIIEYQTNDLSKLFPANGESYITKLFSPDGSKRLRAAGFKPWDYHFVRDAEDQLYLLASLQKDTDDDYNTPEPASSLYGRNVYLFVPKNEIRMTDGGFPLNWKMASNTPFKRDAYSANPFIDTDGMLYVHIEERVEKVGEKKTTCIMSYEVDLSTMMLKDSDKSVLLCPGTGLASGSGVDAWDYQNPFISEIRWGEGGGYGGLLEGASMYYDDSNGKYYILYSSGDYANTANYAGYVAECDSVQGPCRKVLNDAGTDVRVFLAGESKKYIAVGRPKALVGSDGELLDVLFHARERGGGSDMILSCNGSRNNLVRDFVRGGTPCWYDALTEEVMARVFITSAYNDGERKNAEEINYSIFLSEGKDGTRELENGEWFPLTENSSFIRDYVTPDIVTVPEDYSGLIVTRNRGDLRVRFTGEDNNQWQSIDGYVEIRSGIFKINDEGEPDFGRVDFEEHSENSAQGRFDSIYDGLERITSDLTSFSLSVFDNNLDDFRVGVQKEIRTSIDQEEVQARIVFTNTYAGDGAVNGPRVLLGDGTIAQNSEWFPITQRGKPIVDGVVSWDMAGIEDFAGIALSRNGVDLRVAHVGNDADGQEVTEGYLELRNANLIENDGSDSGPKRPNKIWFEGHSLDSDRGIYSNTLDYMNVVYNNPGDALINFGTVVRRGRDAFVVRYEKLTDSTVETASADISGSSYIVILLERIQNSLLGLVSAWSR